MDNVALALFGLVVALLLFQLGVLIRFTITLAVVAEQITQLVRLFNPHR